MKDRVLVTGGAGFVGAEVASELHTAGYDVTIVDLRKPDLSLPWIRGDLLESDTLADRLRTTPFVCHLAAVGDVYEATRLPAMAMRVNCEGTLRLALECAKAGVRKFVYASTWEVYGK